MSDERNEDQSPPENTSEESEVHEETMTGEDTPGEAAGSEGESGEQAAPPAAEAEDPTPAEEEPVPSADPVKVNPAAFEEMMSAAEFGPETAVDDDLVNLDLIMDVSVPVTVCVGSVRKSIAEVLSMTPGHVIDLNRFAGDPVDLMVNDKLIARGEVVVVDDHYGLRITEICSKSERLSRSTVH